MATDIQELEQKIRDLNKSSLPAEIKKKVEEALRKKALQAGKNISDDLNHELQVAVNALLVAGASQEAVAAVQANTNLAALLAAKPELANAFAAKFPSPITDTYQKLNANFFQTENQGYLGTAAQASQRVGFMQGYITDASGNRKRENGVIITTDPATGRLVPIYPNDPAGEVAGSLSWIQGVWDWAPKKVKKWRKLLSEQGYSVDAEGPVAPDLLDALKTYHDNKNIYGRATQARGTTGETTKPVAPDPAEIRNFVRERYRAAYQEDPSDPELDHWEDTIRQSALKLQRKKDYSPEYASNAAEERFIEQFESTPEFEYAHRQDEVVDMRSRFAALAQVMSSMGRA